MFQLLQKILGSDNSLTLHLEGNSDGTITVTVMPRGEGALAQPLALTGTVEELDAGFFEQLSTFVTRRQGLAEQLEATAAVLAAAEQESSKKAAKAISKASKPATSKSAPEGEDNEAGDDAATVETSQSDPALSPDNLFS